MKESNNNRGFLGYAKDWINRNPGRAVGIFTGLLVGVFLFSLGIFKTLLILLFMAIGYYLGRSRDDNVSIITEVTNFFKKDKVTKTDNQKDIESTNE